MQSTLPQPTPIARLADKSSGSRFRIVAAGRATGVGDLNSIFYNLALATATALETGRGEFGQGLAMGFILLAIALGVTTIIVLLSREGKD